MKAQWHYRNAFDQINYYFDELIDQFYNETLILLIISYHNLAYNYLELNQIDDAEFYFLKIHRIVKDQFETNSDVNRSHFISEQLNETFFTIQDFYIKCNLGACKVD